MWSGKNIINHNKGPKKKSPKFERLKQASEPDMAGALELTWNKNFK